MRQKVSILFYFFLMLLSMQLVCIHSQLDFGDERDDDPLPTKIIREVPGGEIEESPVKAVAPERESQSSGSKDEPNNVVAESNSKESAPVTKPAVKEKAPVAESAPKEKAPVSAAAPTTKPSSRRMPITVTKSEAAPHTPARGPPPLPERNERQSGHDAHGQGTIGGRPRPRLPPRRGPGPGQGFGRTIGIPIVPQGVCNLKADPGYCNLMIGRWYYDRRYHRCLPFLYTGCGGNYNNFFSHKQCEGATQRCDFIGQNLFDDHMHENPLRRHLMNPLSFMNPFRALSNNGILAG